nr:hypothetical protein [Tanacetum cinerariifolium]
NNLEGVDLKQLEGRIPVELTYHKRLNPDSPMLAVLAPIKDRYQYEETVDPKEAKTVWVRRLMNRCRADWDGILESWMKPKWMSRSKVGAENKKRFPRM